MEHNGTEGNEMKPTRLNEREIKAIEMRYMGKSAEEIAKTTGWSPSYVRKLFMTDGRLRPYLDTFMTKQNETRRAVILKRVSEEGPPAMERMVELSKDFQNGPTCYKANEYILDLNGIRPKEEPVSYNPVKINIIIHKDENAQDGQSEEIPQS